MKNLLPIIMLLTIVLTACSDPAQQLVEKTNGTKPSLAANVTNKQPRAVTSAIVKCPVALPETDIEGETVYCGEISVPQNWDVPDGMQLTISYAVFKASGGIPLPDPIIYFDGGPGTSTFGELAALASKAFSQLRRQHDLIFWEQRGNLYSSHLDCPDEVRDPRITLTIKELEARAKIQAANPQPKLDPRLLQPTTIYANPQEALANDRTLAAYNTLSNKPRVNCRKYYKDKAVDLTQYNSSNSLRDVLALMAELPYPEYNIYAISYGTTLMLETMRYYDGHSGQDLPVIRSVVIDGVSPLFIDMAEQGLIMPYNVLRVFAGCIADKACAAAYPDIDQRLLKILAQVEHKALSLKEGTEVTLDKLRSLLVFASSSDPASLVYLPRLIDELERKEETVYKLLQKRSGTIAQEVPIGIRAIDLLSPDTKEMIICNDRSASLNVERAFKKYRAFQAPQLITDTTTVVEEIVNCEAWGLMQESTGLPEPVNSDIRTLVSNGAMDSATAVEWGKAAYKSLRNATLVIIPFARHGASVSSRCGKAITLAFFDHPQAVLDLTCIRESEPVFILPAAKLPNEIESNT